MNEAELDALGPGPNKNKVVQIIDGQALYCCEKGHLYHWTFGDNCAICGLQDLIDSIDEIWPDNAEEKDDEQS